MDPRMKWALKQSTRHSIMLLGKLNSKVLGWYANGNFSAIFEWIAKKLGSKSKVGFLADAAANLIKSIEPYLKDLNDKQREAVESIRQKMRDAHKELPEIKKAGKEYQTAKKQNRESNKGKVPVVDPITHKVELVNPQTIKPLFKKNRAKSKEGDNYGKEKEKENAKEQEIPKGLQNPEVPERDRYWRYP